MTEQQLLIAGIVVAVVVVAVVVAVAARRRAAQNSDRAALRERFGPEYERAVADRGNARAASDDLHERERLRENLSLTELTDDDRQLVRRHMAALQFRFVEDPEETLVETGRVVTEVLRVRGFPVDTDREEALRLFSVDHPHETETVRTVLGGDLGHDDHRLRELFLDTRRTLREVAAITYEAGDVALPAGTRTRTPPPARDDRDDRGVRDHADREDRGAQPDRS